jgi:hypothetical protein
MAGIEPVYLAALPAFHTIALQRHRPQLMHIGSR